MKYERYVMSKLLRGKGDYPRWWRLGNVVTGYDSLNSMSQKCLMLMGRCRERRNGGGEGKE